MVAFLLEVGAEELPASFVASALSQWSTRIPAELLAANLLPEQMRVFGGPRRLALLLDGLLAQQPDRLVEAKGPPVQQAFRDGSLTPAGAGFARKQGIDPAALEIRETDKGAFVYAVQRIPGRPTAAVLQEIVPSWILELQGERLMRWGSGDLKFPRPIRWLVALLNDQVLPIELEGIRSGRITQAHRVLHPQPVALQQASEYVAALEKAFVQVDPASRQAQIREQILRVAAQAGGVAEIPPGLLEEVSHLVEWPTAVLGDFDAEFLQLPPAVIKIVMVTHQRYFPLYSSADPDKLLPHFITISNGDPQRASIIAAGNSRVVRARLADAQFFYHEDLKTPLESKLSALAKVTFVEELGSMRDKVDRICQITANITQKLDLAGDDKAQIERVALLCKADLVAQMVYEFPELQGLMGANYARRNDEPEVVSAGIEQHYWPIGAGDPLPQALSAQIVGIADRLDTLVGLFKLGRLPSGSSDRFALRRAANSIVLILWQADFSLDLGQLLAETTQAYAADRPETLKLLQDFFAQRIQTLLQEERGIDYDLVKAVIGEADLTARALADLKGALRRAEYLQQLRANGILVELYPTLNRTARLAKEGTLPPAVLDPQAIVDPGRFQDPAEHGLFEVCKAVYRQGQAAQDQQNFALLIAALQMAAPTVADFFEAVLVMDEDPAIKANRLNMLGILRNNAQLLADFSAVVMSSG